MLLGVRQPRGCRSQLRQAALRTTAKAPRPPITTTRPSTSIQQRVFQTATPCHSSPPSASRRLLQTNFAPTARRQTCPSPLQLPHTTSNALCRPPPLPFVALMTTTQIRSHGSHGHGHGHGHHHHHHDNTYLISKNKNDPGVRITRIGLLANLCMAVGKGFGGYIFHSQALIADAYHSLTDLVSDFLTLATVSSSLRPPTSRFPTGYGKVESIGALGVSGLLLFGGVLMGLNAMEVILTQFFPDIAESLGNWGLLGHGHSHSHGHSHGDHGHEVIGPNINAAWLAAGSIVVKEWLYRATMKIAIQRKSSVLASNAVHHRIDSLTSIVALLTIGGAHVLPDASWLDPVGGLIISLMVIKAGWGNSKKSLLELADVGVEEEMRESVEKSTLKAIAAMPDGHEIQFRNVQGLKSGPNFLMEVELAVPGSWSVDRTRNIEELVRERVGSRVRGVKRLRVRFMPDTERQADFWEEFIERDVSPRSSPEPEEEPNGAASSGSHHHHHHDSAQKRR
ncbi:hypothetical protein AJ80_04284 [Polytolypa hystricis UAMH7299]|uniref:Cation efflux protein transmembrane domain-containing protein n=1 Tax=Polytolypa hystricis (strain UAMH7299) TaxID=1447883 RepID=A0A2B7YEC1_POLH7|nr:hypothetical protein AJ80_04284 [Polytolypa hystricis UAMH7299]